MGKSFSPFAQLIGETRRRWAPIRCALFCLHGVGEQHGSG
jgi:hypothetical protein